MPSNDERREVAARLRELDERVFDCREYEHRAICAVVGCWGDGEYSDMELKDRLADLIEPEPERTCHVEMDWDAMEDGEPCCRIWRCSCGETFPYYRGRNPSFCPECGDKAVR